MLSLIANKTNTTRILTVLAGLLLPGAVLAQAALQGVEVVPMEDDRVSVRLQLSDTAPEPSVFALESPPRISIDLPNARVALDQRRVPLNAGVAQSLTAVEAGGRSRVVISLTELTPYSVRAEGNQVIVEIAGGQAVQADRGGARHLVRSVDFRRSETGAGRLTVGLSEEVADVDVRQEGGKIVAEFKNAQLPDKLIRRMDVLDFATPVKFVDAINQGINARFVITPASGAEFEQVAYQLGDRFTIELQPLTQDEIRQREQEQPRYTGERLNVNFQNISVRALLQIIADVAEKNLVTSDSVQGDMTLRLENVPWDQALDIIMRAKGLSKSEEGNVIWVAPTSEVAAQQEQEIAAREQAEQLAPLSSELMQINYAKATDLAALLRSQEGAFLSERGSITVDERTNKLIVRDTRENLADMRDLIRTLDIPVKQVLIESRIVVANDDFSRQLGVRLGFTGASDPSEAPFFATSGRAEGTDTIVFGDGDEDDGVINTGRITHLPDLDNRFNVNLPISGQAGRIALAILDEDYLVDLELSALQAEGRGELISSPRVVTANGREAFIEQGEEIPFTAAAGGGAAVAQTQFKKAVLSLRATPQITPDDRIVLDLEVSRDSRGRSVPQAGGGEAVGIDTRRVNTQLLVDNGETVVLGGIFEQTIIDNVSKIPLLGDLPLIGFLFRTTNKTDDKRELLIFVTPKILSEGVRVN